MRSLLLPSAMLLTVVACHSDTHSCNLIGCESSLSILIRNATPGDYMLRLDYDDVAIACTFSVPGAAGADAGADKDAGSASSGLYAGTVHGASAMSGHCEQTSGEAVRADLAGGAAPRLVIAGAPASPRVRVTRDGTQLSDDHLTPAYDDVSPNGPDCAPHCRQADATLTL